MFPNVLKMNFSQQELINMVYALGSSNQNSFLASRIYAQRFPNSERYPNSYAFARLKERFERTGSVQYEKNL